MFNFEEFIKKHPSEGWIENGEKYFTFATKIDQEGTYFVHGDGEVSHYNRETDEISILKPYKIKGYDMVKIHGKNYSVARLVAENFVFNPNHAPEVHHKDFNKANNRMSNLKWVTRQEHMAIHCGKAIVMLDKNTGEFLSSFSSAAEAGRELGIPATSIRDCCKHRVKTSHGYIWMYVEEYGETYRKGN